MTDSSPETPEKSSSSASPTVITLLARPFNGKYAMLSIARRAYDNQGSSVSCRVLLDCGLQANFVSKNFLFTFGLKPRSLNMSISDINGAITGSTQTIRLKMQLRINAFSFDVECIVTD